MNVRHLDLTGQPLTFLDLLDLAYSESRLWLFGGSLSDPAGATLGSVNRFVTALNDLRGPVADVDIDDAISRVRAAWDAGRLA